MEHYKSTFATVAIAMSGLILAAQIQQTGPFAERSSRIDPVRTLSEEAEAAKSWTDPPGRPERQTTSERSMVETTATRLPQLALTQMPAPVLTLPRSASRDDAARKAAGSHRHRIAQRTARLRQAALASRAVEPNPPAAVPSPSGRVDVLGDLIRGLGLGGSES